MNRFSKEISPMSRYAEVADQDCWEQSGGFYLEASSHHRIRDAASKLPRHPLPLLVKVPVLPRRGAYRIGLGANAGARREPFTLFCSVFGNNVIGIELRVPEEGGVRPLGRPMLGNYEQGFFGDELSRDTDLTAIAAYIDPYGGAMLAGEKRDGTTHPMLHVQSHELALLGTVCLGAFVAKSKAAAQANTASAS